MRCPPSATRCAGPPTTVSARRRTDHVVAEPVDHKRLIDLLEVYLLGGEPSLTGRELADEVGIPFERARERWRSLGFSSVDEDVPAFTQADLEALRLTQRLSDLGFVDADDEA